MSGGDTPTDWDTLEARIDALLELDAPARAAELDRIAAHDPRGAQRLRDWLAQIDESEGFLAGANATPLQAGQRLGPWQLLAPVGRGGMGEVWRGERADGAFQRVVAIKFLRRDKPSSALQLARERELLARLRHPGIAQLLDGGLTDEAQPYLVTEWVDGDTLDAWLRAAPRTLHERVDMLRRIAEAVAFAHANLVVHRDLKPANVMVDRDGAPRLLDFGIARLIDADLQRAETSDRALTPGFAAPEQVRGDAFTTRTDVYGLGALLYWLLTERAPHAGEGDSLARWVERLTHEAPVAPGARADRRGMLAIDADLDAIALTALAQDPAQRYASADALAQDLARWQRGDAVSARLPTRVERLRRFVRRHRGAVAAAALLLIAILAGVVATRVQQQAALREAARATAVKEFLVQLFTSLEPEAAKGEPVLVDTLVAQGERDLPEKLASQPDVQFEMLGLLAGLRLSLGQHEQRLADTERQCPIGALAFGEASIEHVTCLNELADAYRALQRLDDAQATLDRALAVARTLQRVDPIPLTTALRVQFMLQRDRGDNAAAEAALIEAIAIARAAPDAGEHLAYILEDYAVFLQAVGRRPDALPLLDEVLRYDDAHPDARPVAAQINSRWNMAAAHWGNEDFERVAADTVAMAAFTEQRLGRNHPHWFRFMQLRALAQGRLGRYRDAVATLRDALAVDGIDAWEHGRYRQMLGADLVGVLWPVGDGNETRALATDLLALADREHLSPALAFVTAHGALMAALLQRDAAAIAQWSDELQRRLDALPEAERPARNKSLLQAQATRALVEGRPRDALALLETSERNFRPAQGASLLEERAIAEQGFALLAADEFARAAERLRTARDRLVTRFDDTHVAVAQIDSALAALPPAVATDEELARGPDAERRFAAAIGRPPDRLRLL